jgi:hypothetical protein
VRSLMLVVPLVVSVGACTRAESSVSSFAAPSPVVAPSPSGTSGSPSCGSAITSTLNGGLVVGAGETCVVDARVAGDVRVYGTLVLLDGRSIEGNVEVLSGVLKAMTDSRVKGNVTAQARVELTGARIDGNLTFVSPGELWFAGGQTRLKGNLEFEAPTVVSGSGHAVVDGNATCRGNVVDNHVGTITTKGKKQGCPDTF